MRTPGEHRPECESTEEDDRDGRGDEQGEAAGRHRQRGDDQQPQRSRRFGGAAPVRNHVVHLHRPRTPFIRCATVRSYGWSMGIFRLNHAVLYVRDIESSVRFYTEVLGFRRVDMTPDNFAGAAFLQAPGSTNDHDLGLFEIGVAAGPSMAGRSTVGLYHLAWEVDTLETLEQLAVRLTEAGALVGT